MASAMTNHQCDICNKNQINKDANVWCFECNEFLCSDCLRIHRVQDILKHHKPIQIEDYQKLDPAVIAIKYECDQHGMKYDFYCVDHDTPICVKCVSECHRSCSDVKSLIEVTKNVKESFLLTDLHERTSNIHDIVQHIIKDVSSRQFKVKEETSRAISTVEAARETINHHLDLLQGKIIKEIRMHEKDIQDNISRTLETLQSLLSGIQETLDSLSTAQRYASNFHTFCGINLWNDKTQQREAELMSLQKNLQYFERIDIKVNQKLINLQTDIMDFASIKSEGTKHEIKLLKKDRQGQHLVRKPVASTDTSITLSNPRSFTLPIGKKSMYVCGCCVMESGSMIFTDLNNKRLINFDMEGHHIKDINLSFCPFDIVQVDKETVAVTSNLDKKLVLVNINQGREVRTVYKGESCFGLCYTDGKFYVSGPNKTNKIINMKGIVLSSIVEDLGDYCALKNNSIYFVVSFTGTVQRCNLTGKDIWKYTCYEGDFPYGITVDNKENVLVTCYEGNQVICIDKTGKKANVLLSEKDGLNNPIPITYSERHNVLLVGNEHDGKCFMYHIK